MRISFTLFKFLVTVLCVLPFPLLAQNLQDSVLKLIASPDKVTVDKSGIEIPFPKRDVNLYTKENNSVDFKVNSQNKKEEDN